MNDDYTRYIAHHDEGEEVADVSKVNHASRQGRIEMLHRYPIEHKATEGAEYIGDDLIGGERTHHQTDAKEGTTQ